MSRDRYAQCDETCTVDFGHCKGAGRPAPVVAEGTDELDRYIAEQGPKFHQAFAAAAADLPWCNLPTCPEGDGGAHRITTGRCIVVPAPVAAEVVEPTTEVAG